MQRPGLAGQVAAPERALQQPADRLRHCLVLAHRQKQQLEPEAGLTSATVEDSSALWACSETTACRAAVWDPGVGRVPSPGLVREAPCTLPVSVCVGSVVCAATPSSGGLEFGVSQAGACRTGPREGSGCESRGASLVDTPHVLSQCGAWGPSVSCVTLEEGSGCRALCALSLHRLCPIPCHSKITAATTAASAGPREQTQGDLGAPTTICTHCCQLHSASQTQ